MSSSTGKAEKKVNTSLTLRVPEGSRPSPLLRSGRWPDGRFEGNRAAVLPAFFAVPAVPIEPDDRWDHAVSMYFRAYKRRATVCPYQVSSEGADKLPPSRSRRRCP